MSLQARGSEEEVEGEVEEEDFIDEVNPADQTSEPFNRTDDAIASKSFDTETQEQDFEGEEDRRAKGGVVGRTVTLQMLLATDILQPGEANMSIEYMGQRFLGDLLSDGKIKSLETDIIFASPSAWACHCKRMVNPDKKSGCGWASVKYQGQKLDFFKNKYFKQLQKQDQKENEGEEMEHKAVETMPAVRIVVKHSSLGNRMTFHDANTLVEAVPFSSIGKIQPFLVSLSTNAALVLDFHCHLTTSEVVGYLAGHWDVNSHSLAITNAFPCRSRLNDRELGPLVEEDIFRAIDARRLSLVGWYHSHPKAPPTPTLRDIDSQLEYEMKMKGPSDASYIPCVGLICSPYMQENVSLESSVVCYWVVPPAENKPLEYGKPMVMSYSQFQDQYLSQEALNEMKKCAEFYKGDQDFINFQEKFKDNVTYLEKMKTSLTSKFPRDQNDGLLWNILCEAVCPSGVLPPIHPAPPTLPPITVPSASKATATTSGHTLTGHNTTSQQHPPPPPPPPPTYLGAEIASALFATGKFPTSLMGLFPPFVPPHPTSHTSHHHKLRHEEHGQQTS